MEKMKSKDDESLILSLSQRIDQASLAKHSNPTNKETSSSSTTLQLPKNCNEKDFLKSPQKVRRRYQRRNSFIIDRKHSVAMGPCISFDSTPGNLKTRARHRRSIPADNATSNAWLPQESSTDNASLNAKLPQAEEFPNLSHTIRNDLNAVASLQNKEMFVSPTVDPTKQKKFLPPNGIIDKHSAHTLKSIEVEESPRTPSLIFKPKVGIGSIASGNPLAGRERTT